MSAGKFVRSRYQASYSNTQIHPIRVQPETVAVTSPDTGGDPGIPNDPPAGAVSNPISALSSLNRNARGLRPRYITLQWTGTPPTGYDVDGTVKVVALTQAFFDDCLPGQTVTYLGATAEIVSKEPERVR